MRRSLNFVEWFLPLTVFTIEIGYISLAGFQFDWISQPFFIVSFIIFSYYRKINLNYTEFFVFLFLFFQGIISAYLFSLPILIFFSEFLPILIIYFATKTIIQRNNTIKLFRTYLQFAYYAAIIGFIQLGLKLFFGIQFLTYTSSLWIDSVAFEPSHYVAITLPAAVYLYEKKEFKLKFFIILLSIIFTFKLTAFVSIALYLVLTNFRKTYKVLILSPLVISLLYIIILQHPAFYDRFISVVEYSQLREISSIKNATAFSFISNLEVAINNFKETFGFGVGLGGHESMYYQYFGPNVSKFWKGGLNAASAHSLTIRIISELGLVGIILFITLFIKILKMSKSDYKLIGLASLSHFIVKTIKLGGYFDYGTLFFFTMIIVILHQSKKLSSEVALRQPRKG